MNNHLTLEQLEDEILSDPYFDSNLTEEYHRLHKISINEMTNCGLRELIRQNIALKYLIPVALERLSENPLLRSENYEGDLLATVIRIPPNFWNEYEDCFFRLSEIMEHVDSLHRVIRNDILIFWDRLDKSDYTGNYDCDKKKLVDKYFLKLEDGAWYSHRENAHKHLIFKDTFLQRHDIIGILFRINKLCGAKVKYFRDHINSFKPLKYDYKKGFIETELWDSEFLQHIASGYILDYRYLQSITEYEKFAALCEEFRASAEIGAGSNV